MSNRTYNTSSVPAFNGALSSATIRNEFGAVSTGVGALETEIDAKLTSSAAAVGTLINSATAKTAPVDADYVPLMDSESSNVMKKLSWAYIKSLLGSYIASASLTLSNKTLVAPALGTPASGNLANCTFPTLNQNTTGTAKDALGTGTIMKSTQSGLKMIQGNFTNELNIIGGSGFTVTRAGVGDYTINFTDSFKAGTYPTVVITVQGQLLIPEILSRLPASCWFGLLNTAGAASDGGGGGFSIHFIAIGEI